MTKTTETALTEDRLQQFADNLRHGYRPDIQDCNRLIATAKQGMTGWREIESAPKDGTRVLILEKGRCVIIATWATHYSPFYRGEVSGWWTSSDPGQAHVCLPEEATHWMPLPGPPK